MQGCGVETSNGLTFVSLCHVGRGSVPGSTIVSLTDVTNVLEYLAEALCRIPCHELRCAGAWKPVNAAKFLGVLGIALRSCKTF